MSSYTGLRAVGLFMGVHGMGLFARALRPDPIAGAVSHAPALVAGALLVASAWGMWSARRWAPAAFGTVVVFLLLIFGFELARTNGQYWPVAVAVFAAVSGTWGAIWFYVRSRVRILSGAAR